MKSAGLFGLIVLALLDVQVAHAQTTLNPFLLRARQAESRLNADARGPTAVGPLLELVGLLDRVPDEAIEAPLSGLATGRGVDPLVAAWAQFHLARLHEDRGETAKMATTRTALGLIDAFWVLGPFESQSRSALGVPWSPERQSLKPDPAQTFEGKAQTVAWRRLENSARSGVLLLDAALAPQEEAGALLMVYLNSDKAQSAALRLGSAGPVKAWMNGAQVHSHEVQRVARMDQDAAFVSLRRGENTLVIKTLSLEGAWRLVVRLTTPNGQRLGGVRATLEGKGAATLRAAPGPTGKVRQLSIDLETAWRKAVAEKRLMAARAGAEALARLWAYASPFDRDTKPVERVLTETLALGDDFVLRRLLGEFATQENDRRSALLAASLLTADPRERCLVLSERAELAQAGRRPILAAALHREAVAAAPSLSCWPAVLSLAEETRIAGLPAVARTQLDSLPPEIAALPSVRRRKARVYASLGLLSLAREEIAAVALVRQSDPDVMDSLIAEARANGDTPTLLRVTELMAKHRPDLLFLATDYAKALEGAGQTEAALVSLAAAITRAPGAAELHEARGRLLARMGRTPEALSALGQALSLRPQNPGLRKYVAALAKAAAGDVDEAAADLARQYAIDPWAAVKAALEKPLAAKATDAARVLLDRKVVHVHDNGLSEMFSQRVVHVLSEPGARENESFFIRYTPGAQEVEVRQARVFRRNPSGVVEISSATGRDDRDLSEPWYGLYYDNRAEVVTFEGVRAGDVIELQYTVADVSARNELAGYFGDFQFMAETVPTDLWQYTLLGPKGKAFFFHTPDLPGFSRKQIARGTEVEYQFEAKPVPKVVAEPSMPGWAEIAPYFHVSTYESWDQVGRWYWDLVAEQLVPDAEVKRRALDAVKGKTSLEEKVRAIHKTVIQGTRYVGLEFGIHGYKPYRVSQILSRRFGDCKDKAALMVAMLKVVGIEAHMVLLRTRRGGIVDKLPASLAVFDHAIAYVPALKLYLDGTAEFSGMNELPHQDQATMALRVWPGGSELVQTPVLPSSYNRAVRLWNATVASDGSAVVDEAVWVQGQAAPEWRQHYQSVGERTEKYGKVWNARFPGATIATLEVNGVDDPNVPVTVTAKVKVPALAERQGGALLLPVSSRPPEYLRSYARLSERRTDLLLAYPWQHEETLTYIFPEGFRLHRVPDLVETTSDFGRFSLQTQLASDGHSVTVSSRLDMRQYRFSPKDYVGFRKFLGTVEAALRGRLEVERITP